MKKWVVAVVALLFLALAGGFALAGEDLTVLLNDEPAPNTIQIDLSRNASVQLTASEPVQWTSSSRRRASVDESGLVTALNTGGFTITARAEDKTRRVVQFKVVRGVLAVGITGQSSMTTKQTVRLRAEVSPSNATNKRLAWSSSNPEVVTVNAYGTVKAKPVSEPTTVTITATAQDGTGVAGQFEITVYPIASSVTLLLDGEPVNGKTLDIDLATFNSLRLTAVVSPAAASQSVEWTTSSRRTATIAGGLVEAKRKGNVTITVTTQDGTRLRANCKIHIDVISKQVEITGPSMVTAGKSISLKASVLPSDAGNRRVTWSSSDPAAASVSSSGTVRAGQVDGSRQVVITATAKDGGSSASHVVTIMPRASFVTIQKDGGKTTGTLMLNSAAPGSTVKVSAAVYPAEASQAVKWSSSNSRVASVAQDGTITCRGKGKAIITATSLDNTRARCNIYVYSGDTAAMPYYIEVDKTNQVVRVYERGDGSYTHLIRRMICSTGTWDTHFNNNLYNMNGARMEWCLAGDRQHYMPYATRINGSYFFHGIPTTGRSGDKIVVSYYNKLGTKASGGCVRLLCADAKWIYENVPNDTCVLVTDGVRDPAEYGSVYAPPIVGTWDPTDDNPANPYHITTYTSELQP